MASKKADRADTPVGWGDKDLDGTGMGLEYGGDPVADADREAAELVAKPCEHDLVERECAVTADGMCPLCQAVKIAELEAIIEGSSGWAFEKRLGEAQALLTRAVEAMRRVPHLNGTIVDACITAPEAMADFHKPEECARLGGACAFRELIEEIERG